MLSLTKKKVQENILFLLFPMEREHVLGIIVKNMVFLEQGERVVLLEQGLI